MNDSLSGAENDSPERDDANEVSPLGSIFICAPVAPVVPAAPVVPTVQINRSDEYFNFLNRPLPAQGVVVRFALSGSCPAGQDDRTNLGLQ